MNQARFREILNKLTVKSEEWGATVCEGSVPDHAQSPFSDYVGMDWEDKVLYVDTTPGTTRGAVGRPPGGLRTFGVKSLHLNTLCGMIHEMGHMFHSPGPPDKEPDEFRFLGWEYTVAKQVGISAEEWKVANAEYAVDTDGTSMVDLDDKQFTELLEDRRDTAIKEGYLVRGKPVVTRVFSAVV